MVKSVSTYQDVTTWRLRTEKGIPYRLVERSGSFEIDVSSAQEVYLIRAQDLFDFIIESFPAPEDVSDFKLRKRRRMPGFTNLTTKHISWKEHVDGKPVDPFNGDAEDSHWIQQFNDNDAPLPGTYQPILEVTIDYSNEYRDQDVNDLPSIFIGSGTATGEYLFVTTKEAHYVDPEDVAGGKKPFTKEEGVTIIIPTIEWTLEWTALDVSYWEGVLKPKLDSSLGKVNLFLFTPLFDARPETCLLVGYSTKQNFTRLLKSEVISVKDSNLLNYDAYSLPVFSVDLQIKIVQKQLFANDDWVGHNHVYNPEKGKWVKFYINDDRDTAYELANFDDIFSRTLFGDEKPV